MDTYKKRGYLNSDFKLFHLTDQDSEDLDYHYHDFDKITIFIKGDVKYMIEGKTYDLEAYDIVLVNHNHIHKPFINKKVPYERIIVYISPSFMQAYNTKDYDLSYCFEKANNESSYVLRIKNLQKSSLFRGILQLEDSFNSHEFASSLQQKILFLQFMIYLNRATIKDKLDFIDTDLQNEKTLEIMNYINTNLQKPLSINLLSETFFISKYYMMRTFKADTGYTIFDYITLKRMILAKELLEKDLTLAEIAFECGYNDYSTFFRAYRSFYKKTPRENR